MCKRIFILISILIMATGSPIIAQEAQNPFDLPTTEEITWETAPVVRVNSDNPFDLQPSSAKARKISEDIGAEPGIKFPERIHAGQGTRIGICLLLILPLALLLTLFRGVFNDFLEAAYRDRKFNQFFRRSNSMWVIPHILLYIFFFVSISVFTYSVMTYYGHQSIGTTIRSLTFLVLAFGIFFSIKHAIIYFLGDTFDVINEAKRYSLLILTFNIILGIFLTPINLLLLVGPESIRGGVVVLGFILILVVLFLLLMRSLSLSNRLLLQHSLHFFMYLCSIEIAPLFIVAKLLM